MTEALDAMVKAMIAELVRQDHADPTRGSAYPLPSPHLRAGNAEMVIDGTFDLEKVARAGLETIREPTDLMGLGIGRLDGYRPGSHSPHAIWVAMMAEVLKGAKR